MKSLTNREKTLLKVLAVLLFFSVFILMILKPQMELLDINKAELEATNLEVEELKFTLSRYGKQDEVIEQKTLELNDKDDYILSYMDNEEIAKYVMNYAAKSGIDVVSLTIDDSSLSNFEVYANDVVTSNKGDYKLKDYYYDVNGVEDEYNTLIESKEVKVLKNIVSLRFKGNTDSYKNFITSINDCGVSMYISASEYLGVFEDGSNNFYVSLDLYTVQGKE